MQPDSRLSTLPIPLCSVHPWCQKVKPLSANRWKHLASAQMLAFTYKLHCSPTHASFHPRKIARRLIWRARVCEISARLPTNKTFSARPLEHISPMIVAGKLIYHLMNLLYYCFVNILSSCCALALKSVTCRSV